MFTKNIPFYMDLANKLSNSNQEGRGKHREQHQHNDDFSIFLL